MAQDVYAAFGVGETDTGITTVDADGVALAAIQGLNQRLVQSVEEKDRQIADLRAEKDGQIASLRAELAELKTMVNALAAK
jgi:cell division protein FtsB